MKTYNRRYEQLISIDNLANAYWKARKRKSSSPVVREFDKHWQLHIVTLFKELKNFSYTPRPLKTFVLRDPKTRRICVSDFRDRVVHHALVNVLQPVFEPRFIHDSYASRHGKGSLLAIKRFDVFMRKVTRNGTCVLGARNENAVCAFALKADIKHYFETVDHQILLNIISRYVRDTCIIWLVTKILCHYHSGTHGKGMPLGNWTSQFFANVYLNELDQFVKHKLRAKYYIRYVDDFVILHKSKTVLQDYEKRIKEFLQLLHLELHPTKCQILPLSKGIGLLGFKVFYHHKTVRKRNVRKILNRLEELFDSYELGRTASSTVFDIVQGWHAYAMHGNTYKLRKKLTSIVEKELSARTKIQSTQNFSP